jgi:putative FmdB family regulatory protein
MPLYEFRCQKCGTEFEHIVFTNDKGPVACPKCGETRTERLLSVFSSTSGADSAVGAGSSCRTTNRGFS